MFHHSTHHSVDLEDYFRGPRDINRHSKWPQFLRMHGSVLPKMIVPLTFVGGWATAIVCISMLVHSLEVNSVLLTVTGELEISPLHLQAVRATRMAIVRLAIFAEPRGESFMRIL